MPVTRWFVGVLMMWVAVRPASAQEPITFGGQVRPRFEFRDPDAGAAGGADTFTSMRIRAHIDAALERDVRIFLQIQDVRLWGEETSTLGDFRADNFDVHQGYADLNRLGGSPLSVRAGRQEINLGGERLVGAVGWTQQGRAFDGLRISAASDRGRLDLLGLRLAEATSNTIAANAALVGAYGVITRMKDAALDVYAFYNQASGAAGTDQVTLGVRYAANRPAYDYRFEASLQAGDRVGQEVAAFMFGARVGRKFAQKGKVTFWYDYLSGDDDPADGKIRVFDTLFATNHKFYGFADLFLDIPLHTGGLGLQDIAFKGSATPHADFTVGVDVHSFLLAKRGTQTSRHLGEEVDLTLTYGYARGVALTGGFAYVIADDAWADIGRLAENMAWGYMMMSAAF